MGLEVCQGNTFTLTPPLASSPPAAPPPFISAPCRRRGEGDIKVEAVGWRTGGRF